jgi:ComF family protein
MLETELSENATTSTRLVSDWNRSWGSRVAIWTHHSRRHLREIVGVLLPDQCQLCDAAIPSRIGGGICMDCFGSLPLVDHGCRQCGAPIPRVVGPVDDCVHCRDGRWPTTRVFAYGVYKDKLREAVILMKQPGSEPLALSLGAQLGRWLKRQVDLPRYDRILSTPKHWIKRLAKHHNSAELLSEQISKQLDIPRSDDFLVRIRPTAKQGTLMRQARAKNVQGAFRVRYPHKASGCSFLIVDDIITSGATVAEMTSVLLKAGAARVDVACLARGIGK